MNKFSKKQQLEVKNAIKVINRKVKAKNKTTLKQKLDIEAKELVSRAYNSGRCLVFENPITIGNVSRDNLQDWAGAYLTRRCFTLGEEYGIRVYYVYAAGTSNTCSHCELKDGTKRVKRDLWCCECGIIFHADHNAARNVALRGMRMLGTIASKSGRNNKSIKSRMV